eukprot:2553347-Alexandrium_andersonii.AAC.1
MSDGTMALGIRVERAKLAETRLLLDGRFTSTNAQVVGASSSSWKACRCTSMPRPWSPRATSRAGRSSRPAKSPTSTRAPP